MNDGFFAADYRRIARDKLRGNWPGAVLAGLIAALLGGLGGTLSVSFSMNDFPWSEYFWRAGFLAPRTSMVTLVWLVQLVIGSAVTLGWCLFNMRLVRDAEAVIAELFARFSIIFKALGLRLYMALFIFLWSLLFVVPGIVAAYRYAMAPYLMAENPGMGIVEAVNLSKGMMAGRKGRLFCLHFSFIGWWFLSLLTAGIGLLFVVPYAKAAEAAFYYTASGRAIPLRQ